MKIRIDAAIPVTLIGERAINGEPRYYYTHTDYPSLLIVSHKYALGEFGNRFAIALFDNESVDSTIVCDVLPAAPKRWRDAQLTQCTVKLVRRLPPGEPVTLSEALERNAEKYGYGGK